MSTAAPVRFFKNKHHQGRGKEDKSLIDMDNLTSRRNLRERREKWQMKIFSGTAEEVLEQTRSLILKELADFLKA